MKIKSLELNHLRAYCRAPFDAFTKFPNAQVRVGKSGGRHIFIDRGASILAVAHLDTVQSSRHFKVSKKGGRVYNCQLDDRLGAYLIASYLPTIGVNTDWLFTENEESRNSSAQDFEPAKEYNWCFMFDRAGTDVVMYQYEDDPTCALVESAGARVGIGSCSCIAELEHLGVKGVNWGCGYHDNHSPRAYLDVQECLSMIESFARFYHANKDTRLVHVPYEYDYYDLPSAPYDKECEPESACTYPFWNRCVDCGELIPNKYWIEDLQLCRDCAEWSTWRREETNR